MPANLVSLLYVSQATHSLPEGEHPVEAIVRTSVPRNASLGVTGALAFTGSHFAQVLEGPAASIDELMASILADPRHRNVEIVSRTALQQRRFANWSLAYAGPSMFVDRHIRPLIEGRGQQAVRAEQLIDLMRRFAADQPAMR